MSNSHSERHLLPANLVGEFDTVFQNYYYGYKIRPKNRFLHRELRSGSMPMPYVPDEEPKNAFFSEILGMSNFNMWSKELKDFELREQHILHHDGARYVILWKGHTNLILDDCFYTSQEAAQKQINRKYGEQFSEVAQLTPGNSYTFRDSPQIMHTFPSVPFVFDDTTLKFFLTTSLEQHQCQRVEFNRFFVNPLAALQSLFSKEIYLHLPNKTIEFLTQLQIGILSAGKQYTLNNRIYKFTTKT